MIQRSFSLFSLRFLSGFFIICSLIAPIKGANAVEVGLPIVRGLTVEELRRKAENDLTFEEITLEKFLDTLPNTPEGRQILRNYRLSDGNNSLKHYVSKWNTLRNDPYLEDLVWQKIKIFLNSYTLDDVIVSSEVLDINGLDFPYPFLFRDINDSSVKKFLLTYRNSKGKNLVHLMYDLELPAFHERMSFALRSILNNDIELFVLLNAVDKDERSIKGIIEGTSWGSQLLQKIDLHPLVQPGDSGITPMMRMALDHDENIFEEYLNGFQILGIDIDQQDVYGNSVRSIKDLRNRESKDTRHSALLKEIFKHHPLNANLWDEIVNFPYFTVYPYNLFTLFTNALHVVGNQPKQTPVHQAFLRLEASNEDVRKEARDLWKAFYKTYDNVMDNALADEIKDSKEMRRQEEKIRTLPLAGRYLMSSLGSFHLPQNAELTTKVLIGNSILGLNFSRKITPSEAVVTVLNIDKIARSAEAAARMEWQNLHGTEPADLSIYQGFLLTHINKMVDSFFEAYPRELDEVRKTKLLNHRLNQSLVAVNCFVQSAAGTFVFWDEEALFSFTDRHLQRRVPAGKAVNSKARMEKIKGLLPEDFEMPTLPLFSQHKYVPNKDDERLGH